MIYLFRCPDGREVAGCIRNIVVSAPFVTAQQVQLANGQTATQQVPDRATAFRWALNTLIQRGYVFPPNVQFEPYTLNPVANPQERNAQIISVEISGAATTRINPDVAVNSPVGHAGAPSSLPPQAGAPGRSDFEQLPDAALSGNSDPMVGDIDAAGGTYTDIELQGGMTIERARPADGRMPVRPRTPQPG